MKVGVILPVFSEDPQRVLGAARRAEALGFDGVFSFDHLYPLGGPPDGPALEAFSVLAALAVSTERVELGTLVTRATLRPAGLIAKLAASIDAMSGGRLILAIGSGDAVSRDEHRRYGIGYLEPPERAAQLAETVRAVTSLLAGERFPGGDHLPPLDGPLLPSPASPGGPPVWVGGTSSTAIRIAARFAHGWNAWGVEPERFADGAALLRREADGRVVEPTWADAMLVGRDDGEASELGARREARGARPLWTGGPAAAIERLAAVAAAGATWAILLPAGGDGRLEAIAETVLPELSRT